MSLIGSVRDLPFADIVQILCLSRRSGILILEDGSRGARLTFHRGLLTGIDLPGEESPLIRGIRRQRLVPPQILEQSIRECRRATDSLLKTLAAKTLLDPARVRQVVLGEVRNTIRDLLAWKEGDFRFDLHAQQGAGSPRRIGEEGRGSSEDPGDGTQLRIPEGIDPREMLLEEMASMGAPTVQHFFLPTPAVTDTESVDENELVVGGGNGESARSSATDKWIVLVEERSVYRETLAGEWRKNGFQVETFNTPEAGYRRFAALQSQVPRVCLVTDLVVPETGGPGYAGGLEVLVRARQEFPGSNVILMSEGVDPTVEEAARSLGVRGILEKPTVLPADAHELTRTVRRLADNGLRLMMDDCGTKNSISVSEDAGETIRVVDQLSLLNGLLGELRRPGSELEIPLLVLRLASEYFERGILFAVQNQAAKGLGGFAGNDPSASLTGRCRGIAVPFMPGGHFQEVVQGKTALRGRLKLPEEVHVWEQLGGMPEGEAVLLPVMSGHHVVAILYGDNGKDASPVGDTRGLEIFLGEVGSALESALRHESSATDAGG